jgi:hypothetical protein
MKCSALGGLTSSSIRLGSLTACPWRGLGRGRCSRRRCRGASCRGGRFRACTRSSRRWQADPHGAAASSKGVLLADPDARLVELALVPVRSGVGADRDGGRARDRADLLGFGEDAPVHHDLERGGGLDAGDRVPPAVVDRPSPRERGVAAGASQAARRRRPDRSTPPRLRSRSGRAPRARRRGWPADQAAGRRGPASTGRRGLGGGGEGTHVGRAYALRPRRGCGG